VANFENTIDTRWQPGSNYSRSLVRDQEAEVVFSRELSFVPSRRSRLEAHDAQTLALIARHLHLETLPHGTRVLERLSEWKLMDRMQSPRDKQRYLEPLIAAVRRDPSANEEVLIFLLLVLEPMRRGVSKAFVQVRGGLKTPERDVNWSNRAEARLIQHVEKEALYDVSRDAVLEAIFRYPEPPPKCLFPWFREAIAHRALDQLHQDLPEIQTLCPDSAQASALQAALAGFEEADEPPMREAAGLGRWRARFDMRSVFSTVEEYFVEDAVRQACAIAVARLPRVQGEVITGYFFDDATVSDLAQRRKVTESTVYNHKAQAQKKMREDDGFFAALFKLGRVRDRARAEELRERYPDGRLPDGRRIVHIDLAA